MKTRRIVLFGIPFDTVNESQALLKLHYYSQLPKGEQHLCTTPNPEMIMESRENPKFFDILKNADFSLADGTGILWASGFLPLQKLEIPSFMKKKQKWKNFWEGITSLWKFTHDRKNFPRQIKSRIAGVDLFGNFLATSQARIFLLGGKKKAAAILAEHFPNVVGFYNGTVDEKNTPAIIQQINGSNAEVLFVALGAPKQEFWIADNLKNTTNIRFAMGVGGAFDFLTGYQKRAPKWMQEKGFEWLYRFYKHPLRIGRILQATIGFFFLTIKEKGGTDPS